MVARHVLFQVALVLMASMLPSVVPFTGIQSSFQRSAATIIQQRTSRSFTTRSLGAKDDGEEDDEDQREGMANAFSGLDGLTADDFDDLKPRSLLSDDQAFVYDGSNMEESASLFMEMQAELSTKGEEGLYGDILGDMTGDSPEISDAPTSYLNTEEGDVTGLGQALDAAAEMLAQEVAVLSDADGIGAVDPSVETPLTTADVSNDILNQEIKPSLSMDELMNSAIQEAAEEIVVSSDQSAPTGIGRTDEIAKTAEELLQDDELRKGIEEIFDRAGDKLRVEVETMKKEQEAVTQEASQRGMDYIESEKQRLAQAEDSVSRLIQKVARETDEVQKATQELERAITEDDGGSIEGTALDLKKGGITKQAALVGALLLGSRAVTETILVVGSPYGDQHFVPAILQGAIALACAAYFFLVK